MSGRRRSRLLLFEPLVMFFGLCNTPSTFQTFIDHIFMRASHRANLLVYLDDILIFTETLEEHRIVVDKVLETLERNNLCVKLNKCKFKKDEMEFLGFIVGNGTMKIDPGKVKAIKEWKSPKNKKEL